MSTSGKRLVVVIEGHYDSRRRSQCVVIEGHYDNRGRRQCVVMEGHYDAVHGFVGWSADLRSCADKP